MKLIICGARDYTDYHALKSAIIQLSPSIIAHGTAKGVDSVADEVAQHHRITVRRYAPDGKRHGRFAKHIRNGQMLKDFQPDAVLAILGKPDLPPAADTPEAAGVRGDAGNYAASTIVLRALKAGLPIYTVGSDRALLKLPKLGNDRLGQAALPRSFSPEHHVRALIVRATPVTGRTATPAPSGAPLPKPKSQNIIGEPPYLETGPHNPSPFNPYAARLQSHDGRTIHDAFTAAKIFDTGATGLSPDQAKGRQPVNAAELPNVYTALWGQWLRENPDHMDSLIAARGIANVNAPKDDVCPAQTLWRIRNAEIRRRHLLRLPVPQHTLSTLTPAFNTGQQPATSDHHGPDHSID